MVVLGFRVFKTTHATFRSFIKIGNFNLGEVINNSLPNRLVCNEYCMSNVYWLWSR